MVRERDVERTFTDLGTARGALVLKFTSPGHAGVPDRLVVRPGGIIEMVELKRPGEKPRKLQRVMLEKLARRGVHVDVIDNAEDARRWWAER